MQQVITFLADQLPSLRRYACAFAGSATRGDAYVYACIETALLEWPQRSEDAPTRLALFRLFHQIHDLLCPPPAAPAEPSPLGSLANEARAALLLVTLENFTYDEAAAIVGVSGRTIRSLLRQARDGLPRDCPARVLIVEDEAVTALDLQRIVTDMGHHVCGVAPTRAEALHKAIRTRPTLMLADVRLQNGEDGVEAAEEIRRRLPLAVIYVTAYAGELASHPGLRSAAVVPKPFGDEAVQQAVQQALSGPPA